jgi:hypothetical protein
MDSLLNYLTCNLDLGACCRFTLNITYWISIIASDQWPWSVNEQSKLQPSGNGPTTVCGTVQVHSQLSENLLLALPAHVSLPPCLPNESPMTMSIKLAAGFIKSVDGWRV